MQKRKKMHPLPFSRKSWLPTQAEQLGLEQECKSHLDSVRQSLALISGEMQLTPLDYIMQGLASLPVFLHMHISRSLL